MKHPEHICRFNDGDCTCECFDSGYDQALQAERERLVSEIEKKYLNQDESEERAHFFQLGNNRAIDDILNLINPPSN